MQMLRVNVPYRSHSVWLSVRMKLKAVKTFVIKSDSKGIRGKLSKHSVSLNLCSDMLRGDQLDWDKINLNLFVSYKYLFVCVASCCVKETLVRRTVTS